LYRKKQNLYAELYQTHLENSKKWNPIWPHIMDKINHILKPLMKKKYENINKMSNLMKQKENKEQITQNKHTFYKKLDNQSYVELAPNKIALVVL
jgi:hypothetical protein